MNTYKIADCHLQKQLLSLSEERLQNSYNLYRNYFNWYFMFMGPCIVHR